MARRHRLTSALLVSTALIGLSACGGNPDNALPDHLTAVAVGDRHSCAIDSAGAAWCWGSNRYGQLGTGDAEEELQARPVTGNVVFTSLSAGKSHTCGIDPAGALWCWGGNFVGQLGTGEAPGGVETAPRRVTGLPGPVREVSAGSSSTCAVTTTAEAWCWGENLLDQLGVAGIEGVTRGPTKVPIAAVRSTALYLAATCLAGQKIHCHGRNFTRGASAGEYPGVEVKGPGVPIEKIATSNTKICVLDIEEHLHCLYSLPFTVDKNGVKQPGFWTPSTQVSDRRVTAIAGAHATFCAVYEAREIVCDGLRPPKSYFLSEEVINPNPASQFSEPWTVTGPTGRITSISGGTAHFCAGNDAGKLWCWGWNESGQLGTGDRRDRVDAALVN